MTHQTIKKMVSREPAQLLGLLALCTLSIWVFPARVLAEPSGQEDQNRHNPDTDPKKRDFPNDPDYDEAVEVVVTAERTRQSLDDSAASVSAIQKEQLDKLAPTDITDVLVEVPGVDTQRMSPGGYATNVSIRGSSDFKPGGFGNRVLVLLDSRPVNAPDTHGVDWSALPIFDIGRVEVLRGPASALYGSTAVGGVIQLFTRRPKPGVELRLGQGFTDSSANLTKLAASLSDAGTLSEDLRWGFRLSGWLQHYAGLQPARTSELRHNSDSLRDGLRLVGALELSDAHRLSTEISWTDSEGGNPGFEGTSLASRSRRFQRASLGTRIGWDYQTKSSLKLNTSLFYNRFRANVKDPDGGNPNQYETDRLGLHTMTTFLVGDLLFNTLGAETQWHRVRGDVYQLDQDLAQVLTGALFAQSQLQLIDELELTAGLRLDAFHYSTNQRFVSFSPKLRLTWRPDSKTVMWMSANRGFRAPSLGELYLSYETTFGLNFQGNPNLEPEVVWAFEMGVRRHFIKKRLRLEAIGFFNLGDSTIEFDYRTLPVSAKNLEGSRIAGVELAIKADPAKWFSIDANLTWMHAQSLPDKIDLLYRPDWKGYLAVGFHSFGLFLDFRLTAISTRKYDDFLNSDFANITTRTLDAYALFDTSLTWKSNWGIWVQANVRNLMERSYNIIQGYPAPGREWYLEISIPLDEP